MNNKKYMQLLVPDDINLLLRRYALELEKGSREKAALFILERFLREFFKKEKGK